MITKGGVFQENGLKFLSFRALEDAAKKDLGFSPLTLSWVLHELPIEALGNAIKLDHQEIQKLLKFRDELVEKLTEASAP